MATKKKTTKKAPVKTAAPKKTVKKTTTRKATTRKDSYRDIPGGILMYVFLIIAAGAAIVAVAGIILENGVDTSNMTAYEDFFTFIKKCRDVSLGIFGIFLVLACFMKLNQRK